MLEYRSKLILWMIPRKLFFYHPFCYLLNGKFLFFHRTFANVLYLLPFLFFFELIFAESCFSFDPLKFIDNYFDFATFVFEWTLFLHLLKMDWHIFCIQASLDTDVNINQLIELTFAYWWLIIWIAWTKK